jgi:predicted Zn-dependent peptidase
MKPKKTVLKNGLRVVSVPLKDNPTVTVVVLVAVGSNYETKDINGISHFLEHLCFKGTTNRPTSLAIMQELDGMGAETNAFTGQEYTGYYAKAAAKKLPKLVDIIGDLFINPTIPEEDMEKEKGVIIDEISMYDDMPHIDVNDVFTDLLYGDQPAGWKILGSKENILGMTRDQILAYRNKHYVAGRTAVIIVGGGVDHKQAVSLVEKRFDGVAKGSGGSKPKTKENQTVPRVCVKQKETDQTHVVLGVRTFGHKYPANTTIDVLSVLLGGGMSSRLFQRIRDEMGVGYYINASNVLLLDHGYFRVKTGVNNDRVVDVVRAILEEFARLKDELVSEEELAKAKEYMSGNLLLGLESSDSISEYIGLQEILDDKIKTPAQKIREIKAVTPGDIRRVARKIFVNDRLNLALVGAVKDARNIKKYLKI